MMLQKVVTAGLINGQRLLKAVRWLVIQHLNWSRSVRLWQPRKMSSIGSEDVGAGSGVGATIDALPQLAAEAEGSGGAKDWQGVGYWGRRSLSPCVAG
jgi:hypothetical protein